jgi:putative transcriptional regulator
MGLVINRQTEARVAHAFPDLKLARDYAPTFFRGGPVEPSGVLALWRTSDSGTEARHVLPDVQLVSTRPQLEALIASQTGTDRLRVFAGYSGWAPGQLDRETVTGSWHVFSIDASVVFDPDPVTLWDRQVKRAQERFAWSPNYPSLSTSTGSILAARQAGRNAARVPTAAISATAPTSVAMSRASSP